MTASALLLMDAPRLLLSLWTHRWAAPPLGLQWIVMLWEEYIG